MLTNDAADAFEPLGATPPSSASVAALHGFLGATPSQLAMVQLDLIGIAEQANLPGTTTSYPNWRRKLPLDIDEASKNGAFEAPLDALRRHRRETAHHDG